MNINKQKALENMAQIQRDVRATAVLNEQRHMTARRMRDQLNELSAAVLGLAHALEGLLAEEIEKESSRA